VLFNMDKPTLCAINGAAAGYGLIPRWVATSD
jgi:enoyl-CoA hydratase/carnithine racemase